VLVTVLVVGTAALIAHQARRSLSGGTLGLIVALGLVPTIVWAVLVPSKHELLVDPGARLMVYAPWLLAVVAACIFAGIVLVIAWVVNYRPGAIAPVLAVLFAVPVMLFETKVGRDELRYRVLESQYGPRARSYFREEDVRSRILEHAQQRWLQDETRDLRAVIDNIELQWELQLEPIPELKQQVADEELTALAAYQYEVVRACDEFCRTRSHSRYIPNVLFLKGRALDMRVDILRFRREGVLSFYDDFVNPISEQTWATLLANYAQSPLAAVAMYKLANFRGRQGQVPQAVSLLQTLIERFGKPGEPAGQGGEAGLLPQIFARKPPAATLDVHVPGVVEQARELLELLQANGDDPIWGYAPVAELLQLDRRSPWYDEKLESMLQKYRGSLLEDNLALDLAMAAESVSRRISSLQELQGRYPRGDSLPELLFRLGELLEVDARPEEARLAYTRVVQEHRESVWAVRAARRLGQLELRAVLP
jgi:hypothetical protein